MSGERFPIRPVLLIAENFRGLAKEHSLDLDRELTVLVGRNGAGKSSLLVAMEWCLFGAEATRKSDSGIAERGDWSLAYDGAAGDVRVTLELAVEGGLARLTRCRTAGGKARQEDDLLLELSDEEVLRGKEVQDWLAWNQLPDWKAWKRSFCQHQELSRARVTEAADRSTAIAGMLGLDEYRKVSDDLKKLKVKRLEQRATEELASLQGDQLRALERPGLELRDLENQLERHGVAVAQAGEAELERRTAALITSAQGLAGRLGIDDSGLPDADGPAAELQKWAQRWPTEVRRMLDVLSRERGELAGRVQSLGASFEALEPARRAEADSRNVRDRLATELGSVDGLRGQRAVLAEKRTGLEAERQRRDALGSLLRDAVAVVKDAQAPDRCPVCDQDRSDLERAIQAKLDERAPDSLEGEFADLDARDAKLQEQITKLEEAGAACETNQRKVRALEEQVRGQLPVGASESASIDELQRGWQEDVRRLGLQCEAGEAHITQHRGDAEVVAILAKLRDARARARVAAGELTETPEFQELQGVIDAAAGFASDLEALGSLARQLEDERSDERIASVNESIDSYFSMIVGASQRGRVRVQPKKTATKVSYQLVDERARVITGLMNQAAFNALSLAALFASAESRARQGLPQFLVLDDPGQNLDDAHQAGLASALATCAGFAPVLVATIPGALAEALSKADAKDVRTFSLTRTDDGTGTLVREA
ncbi:MAG: AAA family ATPase [Deltaproteobacteria bacterium]|nr:AAA family ATPase [Deltaproteobacteria bacterium]